MTETPNDKTSYWNKPIDQKYIWIILGLGMLGFFGLMAWEFLK